ncbi:hypothetical protein DFQ14_1059 [Halopolyspora algeriensis]|uniref:PH domain-containing protein n=1 Tax=Halopolyspora algeriensis TaxID=1500506 RepID=A0A368VQI3_9ACTN|nr:transporter [Halopolyspora algeriensis]RCW43868.1 hypothetical protein DFQ14_1059 [Halopolyspora algeriensis]TQM53629.1 hypothetical protein FHU43_1790 [Halopolyspora algeriensis]
MARTLWVLALVVLAVLVLYGMRRGWLRRARHQAERLAEFPSEPDGLSAEPELLPAADGLYVGTTQAGDWQDRIVMGDIGHRASATARLRRSGLLLERSGAGSLWIPAASLRGARVDHKLANKVVPGAGLLVVTWQLGQQWLDTGFRAQDKTVQTEWAAAVRNMVPSDGWPQSAQAQTEQDKTEQAQTEQAQTEQDETAGTRQEAQ